MIEPAEGGGTTLCGTFRSTFSWPTPGGIDRDVAYLVETLHHVAGFTTEAVNTA